MIIDVEEVFTLYFWICKKKKFKSHLYHQQHEQMDIASRLGLDFFLFYFFIILITRREKKITCPQKFFSFPKHKLLTTKNLISNKLNENEKKLNKFIFVDWMKNECIQVQMFISFPHLFIIYHLYLSEWMNKIQLSCYHCEMMIWSMYFIQYMSSIETLQVCMNFFFSFFHLHHTYIQKNMIHKRNFILLVLSI